MCREYHGKPCTILCQSPSFVTEKIFYATKFLRYLPSLTWSTWPYVTRYENFGQYISEVLELIFLVPNAVPQITYNYCTGVLWTIAVQLQGTWLILLGVIVVREMKTG